MIFQAVSADPGIGRTLEGGLADLGSLPKAWRDIRSMDELTNRMAKVTG